MKTDEIINAENRFLAYFSHDIRMPVTGIIGMTDIALENIGNKEKLEECLIKIKNSSGYLLSLANSILDMVQYSNGSLQRINGPFDIEEFIRECTSLFSSLLYNRDIDFITSFPELPIKKVCGDSLHLKQILVNLFENSVKYTHDGGEIRFETEEVRYDNSTVTYCFIISDTGIGMSEEFASEMFKPFTQEKADNTIKYSGNGLGMAITKQFADMIGCDIKIDSKKGEGTTARVMVTFDIDNSFKKKENNKPKASFNGRNILVVDDSDINAEVICGLLEQRGAYTTMALDGRSAVKIFMDSEPDFYDAVLMDVTMPVMNGLEATKRIRSLDRKDASDVLVFAMTGNIFKDDIAKCREAGMDGHLIKPVNLDEFMEKMLEYGNNKKDK